MSSVTLQRGFFAALQKIKEKLTAEIPGMGSSEKDIAAPSNFTDDDILKEWFLGKNYSDAIHLNETETHQYYSQLMVLSDFLNSIVYDRIWTPDGNYTVYDVYGKLLAEGRPHVKIDADYSLTYQNMFAHYDTAHRVGDSGIPVTEIDRNPDWRMLKLNKDEINKLLSDIMATPFKSLLNEDGQSDEKIIEISSIEFEYAYLPIKRTWMQETFFLSNKWKLDAGNPISEEQCISEAATFEGAMPAYPIAIVVGKNFKIQFTVSSPETYKSLLDRNSLLRFGPVFLRMNMLENNQVKTLSLNTSIINQKLINTSMKEAVIKANPGVNLTATTSTSTLNQAVTLNPKFINASTVLTNPTVTVPASAVKVNPTILTIDPNIKTKLNQIKARSLDPPVMLKKSSLAVDKISLVSSNIAYVNFAALLITNLKGTIADSNSKKPIADADISLICTDGKEPAQQVKANASGEYKISLSRNKSYNLHITKRGYKALHQQISTGNSNELILNHLLTADLIKPREEVVDTDIRLIAVVYKKLGNVPNPDPTIPVNEWI